MEPRKGRWDTFLRSLILAWLCLSSSGVIARNIERYDTAYECEGKTLKIECREGELIHLIRANYGRFSITICNEHGNTDWSVNCMSPKSFRVLYNKCNNQQNCSIVASTSMFGDPCPNTLKYLEAHYQCVSAATTTTSTRPSPPSWILTSQPSVWSTVSPPASRPPSRLSTPSPGSVGSTPASSSSSSSSSTPASARQSSTPGAVPSASSSSSSSSSAPSSRPTSTRTWTDNESGGEDEDEFDEDDEAEAGEEEDDGEEDDGSIADEDEDEDEERLKSHKPAGPGQAKRPPSQRQHHHHHHHHHQHQQEHGSVASQSPPPPPPPQQPQAPFTSTITPWKTGRRTPPAGVDGEAACPSQRARNLAWNATRLGESAVQSCPGGANGLARWLCVSAGPGRPGEAVWQRGTPNLSECRSVWLSSLEKRVQEDEVILRASSELSQVTNNSRELYGGDMLITTKILSKMAERMAQEVSTYQDAGQREVNLAELLQGAVTTGSNLLDKAQAASWKDLSHLEQMQVATSLLIGLEENAFLLADTLSHEKNIVHERRNILMEVRVLDARNLKDKALVFPDRKSQRERWSRLEDQVELTQEALLDNQGDKGLVRLVFMAFDRLEEILQPEAYESSLSLNEERRTDEDKSAERQNVTRIINSKVISASLGKGRHMQFKDPSLRVRLYFRHLVTENVTSPKCVFWDYTTSGWSEDGCVTKGSNETHTICECNHLTNFAILMEVQPVKLEGVHAVALQIITYVGCIISIICLILAIITFQVFRGLKSDRTTIHKNLCVCLLIAEVLFICGIDQTDPRIVCGIVAGLLHFFFLCAFAWMFLEGFQLYVMLIEVFEAEKSRLRWYYLFAYGLPLLVVAISCVINPQGYGTDDYCWLKSEDYFVFSFVGPVILVILANLVFLSMAIYMMCRHANTTVSMKSKEHSRLASASGKEENALPNKLQAHLAWLRGAIVLVFLLGLTWTFGLLYLNHETVVMAYIFTVLNSLQGLFIFLFHCVQNEKVRKEYRKFIRRHSWLPKCLRCSKDSGSGSGTGSGSGGAGTSGGHPGGHHGGKDFASHNTSSNPSGPTTDSSGLSPHTGANSSSNYLLSTGGPAGTRAAAAAAAAWPTSTTPTDERCQQHQQQRDSPLVDHDEQQQQQQPAAVHHLADAPHHHQQQAHQYESHHYQYHHHHHHHHHEQHQQQQLLQHHVSSSFLTQAPDTPKSGTATWGPLNKNLVWKNISSKPHARDLDHEVGAGGPGHHNAMTLQGYSLRARERRLIAELEVGSRATTGRRAHSPYNHFYTEIREQQLQQQQAHLHHHYHHHHPQQQQQPQDDPVYEEIERATGQASDMSDEDGRRQSDMSRQSSRSYGDHRPLIPYSPGAERGGLEAAWAIERLRRQQQQQQHFQHQHHHHHQQQQQQQQQLAEQQQQLRPQDHTRTVAVLDGHTVVCHLQPQAELYAARGLAPPSYSEC